MFCPFHLYALSYILLTLPPTNAHPRPQPPPSSSSSEAPPDIPNPADPSTGLIPWSGELEPSAATAGPGFGLVVPAGGDDDDGVGGGVGEYGGAGYRVAQDVVEEWPCGEGLKAYCCSAGEWRKDMRPCRKFALADPLDCIHRPFCCTDDALGLAFNCEPRVGKTPKLPKIPAVCPADPRENPPEGPR